MFYKLLKLIFSGVVIVVALVCISVLSITLFPQSVLWLGSKLSDYPLSAEQLDIDIWPLSVDMEQLTVLQPSGQPFVQLDKMNLLVDWRALMAKRNNVWLADMQGGTIDFRHQVLTTQGSGDEAVLTPKLNIHTLLSALICSIKDVQFVLNDETQVKVNALNTSLNGLGYTNDRDVEQTIDMHLVYGVGQQSIPLQGTIKSTSKDGIAHLLIDLPALDLSPLQPSNSLIEEQLLELGQETVFDWDWLHKIDPIRVNLKSKKLSYSDYRLQTVDAVILLDQHIIIERFTSRLNLSLGEDYRFDDVVSLSGRLNPIASPTGAADLVSDLSLSLPGLNAGIKGLLNINGVADQAFDLNMQVDALPFKPARVETTMSPLEQYLPLRFLAHITTTEQGLSVNDLRATAGESDLDGEIHLSKGDGQPLHITAKLASTLLSYQQPPEPKNAERSLKNPTDAVFNDSEIDWPWQKDLRIESTITAEQLLINQYQFSDAHLPFNISESALSVSDLSAGFAAGQLVATLELMRLPSGADIKFDFSMDGLNLEAADILPKDQISGGRALAKASLSMAGNTSHELASSLNGTALFEMDDARLNNKSFNLVGEDLLMEALSKLNPFTKSDSHTAIECLVVNADIRQGKMHFDDSAVIETDKMAIIGNGYLDLGRDKVNIALNPRAQRGIGLNAGTVLKLMQLGGTLSKPKPIVSAGGLLKTGVAIGAAVSTGGVSLLADGLLNKEAKGAACQRALNAFSDTDG